MDSFLEDPGNKEFKAVFNDFHITLVCDGISLTGVSLGAFEGYVGNNRLTRINWSTFLRRTQLVHQDFLEEAKKQRLLAAEKENDETHGN